MRSFSFATVIRTVGHNGIGAALACLLAASAVWSVASAGEILLDPPGNRSSTQPKVYGGSWALTLMQGRSFDTKYRQAYRTLADNPAIVAKIKETAKLYGIDPIHIVGAIVGEHTFNISAIMSMQNYYVKALGYASSRSLAFESGGESAAHLFARPEFDGCSAMPTNYELWDCRQTTWNDKFAGRIVGGRLYSSGRLHRVFFAPMHAGQTLGLAQLSPVAALMVTDIVHEKSGLPLLHMEDASQVYEQIMNPDTTLHYVAANIRVSIDLYRSIAGIDISQNPGITATLYNLGNAATRARALRAQNDRRAKAGKPPQFPQENFCGWLVNDRLDDLRKLLES
jgi:hypothetical protein